MIHDERDLRPMLAKGALRSTLGCPDEMAWILLALGQKEGLEQTRLVSHAVDCSACAVLLRHAMAAADEQSPWVPDRFAIPAAQKPASERLLGFLPSRKWSWGAVLAPVLVLTAATWFWMHSSEGEARQIVTRAYERQRPLEYRIAGVPWGPVAVQRGRSHRELLSAIKINGPEEQIWAARAAFWEKNYPTALRLLERGGCSLAAPRGAECLNDLAVVSASLGKYDEAEGLLRQAQSGYPEDKVVLFNLAVLLTQTNRAEEAKRVLALYSKLEQDHNWRQEAELLVP